MDPGTCRGETHSASCQATCTIDGTASPVRPLQAECDEDPRASATALRRHSDVAHHDHHYQARDNGSDKHARDTLEPCVICLEPIADRAVASPCNHLSFDFLCLVSWLQEKPSCPLCKAEVVEVQYDWQAPDDFKTFPIPKASSTPAAGSGEGSSSRQVVLSQSRHLLSRNLPPPRRRASQWQSALGSTSTSEFPRSESPFTSSGGSTDPTLAFRRSLYTRNIYSLRIGSNARSQHRDFAAGEFARDPSLQSRARIFLRRELAVFAFLDVPGRGYLVEYIVTVLRAWDVKGADGKALELVAEFLGRRSATLLLHELEAWLRSPFDALEGWDREVQYGQGLKIAGA